MKINKRTLQIAGYTAAIFMFSLLGCKKIDYFLGRYHISVDAQTQHGNVLLSTDGTSWQPLHSGDDTVVQEGKYWFKVECDPDYQFNGWKQTDIPFANESPTQVTINNNVNVFPDITISKKEHIVTLKPFSTDPMDMVIPDGTVQYAINGGNWVDFAINAEVTVQETETISIRVKDNITPPAPNPIYFWGWLGIPGVGPTTRETPPMKLTNDFSFTAEFKNYEPIKVAIKPIVDPAGVGKIQWSTTQNGTYTDLKTAEPYDSIFRTQSVFVKTVATNPYYQHTATPFTISTTSNVLTPITADIYKATIEDFGFSTITANFEKIKYTLTAAATLPTGITAIAYSTDGVNYTDLSTTAIIVDAGSDIYFKTTVDNGYEFGNWVGDIAGPDYLNGANITTNPTAKYVVKGNIVADAKVLTKAIITIKAPALGTLSYTLNGGAETPVTADVQVIVPTGETLVVKATGNTATPYSRFDKFNTTITTGTPGTFTTNIANQTATLSAYTGKLGDAFTIAADFVKQLKIEVPALPTGASAFTIAPNKNYATTAGYQPTLNTPVAAGNTAYIDDGTQFIATATPITTDPDYFRFKAWIAPLTGTIGNQANTANAYTPTADMTVPLPTFQRQWKLTIVAPLVVLTEGSFNTGTTSLTTTPGNQPATGAPATRLQSITGRLEGYFDDNTSISIASSPAINQKIRYSLNSAADAKITSFPITQNTTLKGTSSPLAYIDLFNYDDTLSSTSNNATGNNEFFSALYTNPEGETTNNTYGKITFTIDNSNRLTSIKIVNTSTVGTYSGIYEDFGVTAPVDAAIVGNVYSYALTTTKNLVDNGAGVFNVPAGTPIKLQFTLIGDGNGSMQIQLIGSGPNGTIGINTISSTKP